MEPPYFILYIDLGGMLLFTLIKFSIGALFPVCTFAKTGSGKPSISWSSFEGSKSGCDLVVSSSSFSTSNSSSLLFEHEIFQFLSHSFIECLESTSEELECAFFLIPTFFFLLSQTVIAFFRIVLLNSQIMLFANFVALLKSFLNCRYMDKIVIFPSLK